MGQVWEVFDSIKWRQSIVAQEKFLDLRKLESESVLLRLRVALSIDLHRAYILIIEWQLVTSQE